MFLLNNVKVHQDIQRTIDDVQYPAGWFSHNAEARAKVGMIEVPDPIRPDDDLFTSIENPDGSYTATSRTDEDIAEIKLNKDTQQALSVRQIRNDKLKDCDWTQIADSVTDKVAWATYRQELRDISNQTGFPWDITWAKQP